MSIFYDENLKTFALESKDTCYLIHINDFGYVEHLYYGAKIPVEDLNLLYAGGSASCSVAVPGFDGPGSYMRMTSEFTFYGTGDYREPTVSVTHPDGSQVSDFRYKSYDILDSKPAISGMPSLNGGETLVLHLADTSAPVECDLYYTVYEDCPVIARHAVYKNAGSEPIRLERAYSFAMTLPLNNYDVLSLPGSWSNERYIQRTPMHRGVFSVDSKRITSSATLNPFIAVMDHDATETGGRVFGFSLVYSSSFVFKVEGDSVGKTLVTGGINDFDFSWKLDSGDSFETPEVVIAFSNNGIGEMSRAYHKAFRDHLINPDYVKKQRPIVINNWEGTYFNFDYDKLAAIAEAVEGTGIDTFVLDDGWFGARNNDRAGLGDWYVNEQKLVGGLDRIISKVNSLGMKFGLWFEPEMVNKDSDLFRAHPDYAIGVPYRPRCVARHQYVLDITRADVRDYVVNAVNKIIQNHHIEYVKWDYNRNITDSFSFGLPADRQAEFAHRYALGLYDLCERIVKANPNVFFEGCAGGGARFDPAMLYYFPQIWASDDTDAEERTKIQYGTSVVYPASSISCHVSAVPNYKSGRMTEMKTRADVAHFGATGYELDTSYFTDEDRAAVTEQVNEYKEMQDLVLCGDLYRLADPFSSNDFAFMFVSEDKKTAVATFYRRLAGINAPVYRIRLQGLDRDTKYYVKELDTVFSGATLMEFGLLPFMGAGDFMTRVYHINAVKK